MDRQKTAALLIAGVVATAVIGVVAGQQISSPAEQAARTQAPDASNILVPVEDRVLTADVVTRGTGRFGSPRKLSVATSALKTSPGFIADMARAGTELDEGALLLTASGRPLFLLVGDQPLARDLGPGMSGDDVRQLEDALARLDLQPGTVDGIYDDDTQSAVAAWYDQNGFSPFTATADQLATIRTREAELTAARLEILNATDSIGNADAAIATAQSALTSAQNRLSLAKRALLRAQGLANTNNGTTAADVTAKKGVVDAVRSGRGIPGSANEIAAAQADLDTARANATLAGVIAARAVADAQAVVDTAPGNLQAAIDTAASADAAAQADVSSKQAALDALNADPASTPEQLAVATADLATAQANAQNVHISGLQAVGAAQAVASGAQSALQAARAESTASVNAAAADVASKQAALNLLTNPAPPTAADIAAAEADLAAAISNQAAVRIAGDEAVDQANVELANAQADVTSSVAALTSAQTAKANAQGSLAERTTAAELAQQETDLAHREAGVQVPADEVVFVAVAPVRLSELLVASGDPAAGGIMQVTDSQVFVDGSLAVEDAELVATGMTVTLDEVSLGIDTEGVVSFVAEAPGTNGVDGFHIYFELSVADAPTNLVGASVRLTIPVQTTGDSVLAVPVSALTMGPDGSSRVQVDTSGGIVLVEVKPGLSADGYVEITPVGGASLQAGDLVVIGLDPRDNSASDVSPTDTTATGSSVD